MHYREDIDGLRAVAVILVLFYHLNLQEVPGGFVGVDVFFVISGFLITRIIADDIAADQFSFGNFYLRRLRRLGPALLATCAMTLAVGWFLFPPEMYAGTGLAALSAILSVGNIYFLQQVDYFNSNPIFQPLLHMWSLGVEEQFYLIWPALLLILLTRWTRTWALAAIAALSLVSLVASELLLTDHPNAVFYLMPFRVFEFGVGAALALTGWQARHIAVSTVASIGGLVIILMVANTMTAQDRFPGLGALTPAIAAGLMIYAGPQGIMNRALAVMPIRYIGRISYSLYLVHWPLIIFFHFLVGRPQTAADVSVLLVASIGLGALSYHVIETPARRKAGKQHHMTDRAFLRGFGTATAGIICLCIALFASGGAPVRYPPEIRTLYSERANDVELRRTATRDLTCNGSDRLSVDYLTSFYECLPDAEDGLVVVMGDSHAGGLYMGLKSVYPDVAIVQMTANSCDLSKPFDHPYCSRFWRIWQPWLRDNAERVRAIIYTQDGEALRATSEGGTLRPDGSRIRQLTENLTEIGSGQVQIIFWGPRPSFDPEIRIAMARSQSLDALRSIYPPAGFEDDFALDTLLARHFANSQVHYVSSATAICNPICPTLTRENKLFIMDRAHWTPSGAAEAVTRVVSGEPFLQEVLVPPK